MDAMMFLIPAALSLAGLGLAAFFWALKSGQYDDLEGAAARILIDDEEDRPSREPSHD
jgi:cbb3-type cytochrome oxidase maturation protein